MIALWQGRDVDTVDSIVDVGIPTGTPEVRAADTAVAVVAIAIAIAIAAARAVAVPTADAFENHIDIVTWCCWRSSPPPLWLAA